jgi:hypothetical protein
MELMSSINAPEHFIMYYNKKQDDFKYINTILQNIVACTNARNAARDKRRQIAASRSNNFLELANPPAHNTITSVLDFAAIIPAPPPISTSRP